MNKAPTVHILSSSASSPSCTTFSSGHRRVVENISTCQMWDHWDWTMWGDCDPRGKDKSYNRDSMLDSKTVTYMQHPITTGVMESILNYFVVHVWWLVEDSIGFCVCVSVCVWLAATKSCTSAYMAGLGYWSTTTDRLETCHYFCIHPSAFGPHVRFSLCLFLSALGSGGIMEEYAIPVVQLHPRHDSPRIANIHTHQHIVPLSLSLSLFFLLLL